MQALFTTTATSAAQEKRKISMKILILSINYWPEVTGIGAFTTYRAEHLAAAGHDVQVCTTFPYYPEWKVGSEYAGKVLQNEERNGVRIARSWAYVPQVVSSIKRILHEGSFVLSSLLRAFACRRPDVLFVISPPLGLTASAIVLSRLWRIPFVFDVEDLQPDSAAEHGMLPGWALKFLYGVEAAAYRHAALVTTLTSGMRKQILAKGVPAEKVALIEPRMDDSLTEIAAEEGHAFRARFGIGAEFLVVHSGNIGVKQGLDVIVDAAEQNREDASTLFLVVGDGADRQRVQQRAEALKLENLRFLPLLDETDFRGLLRAAGVCLVMQRKSASDIAFPSKAVTYLAAGCPVIAAANAVSEIAQTICESEAGAVVEAENPAALRAAILELKASNQEQKRRNAQKYADRRWSSVRVLGNLEQWLKSVTRPVAGSVAREEIL
jgi:colanic acid biosynthesis glycosyl transferase WcaI